MFTVVICKTYFEHVVIYFLTYTRFGLEYGVGCLVFCTLGFFFKVLILKVLLYAFHTVLLIQHTFLVAGIFRNQPHFLLAGIFGTRLPIDRIFLAGFFIGCYL